MPRILSAQLLRFVVVGVSNTAVTLAAYAGGLHAGVRYLPAAAGAFGLGALNGFVLNRGWTFGHRGAVGAAGLRYLTVALVGLGADLALLRLGVRGLGLTHVEAQVLAVGPVTLLTFALNRVWTFRTSAALAYDPSPPPLPLDRARRHRGGGVARRGSRIRPGRGRPRRLARS